MSPILNCCSQKPASGKAPIVFVPVTVPTTESMVKLTFKSVIVPFDGLNEVVPSSLNVPGYGPTATPVACHVIVAAIGVQSSDAAVTVNVRSSSPTKLGGGT